MCRIQIFKRRSKTVTKARRIRFDPEAPSTNPSLPGFLARPKGAPVYHGFPIVPETETDGWLYGAITDYEVSEPLTMGDGFVIAPDGSRAGVAWSTDTPEFYEILPPDDERWGVYGVRFPRPVASLEDLIFNFRAVLPRFKERYASLRSTED
jgi:hypothetical protein